MNEQIPRSGGHGFLVGGIAVIVVLVLVFGFRSQTVQAPESALDQMGEATSTPTVSPTNVPAGSTVQKPATNGSGSALPTVSYTAAGFSPAILEIGRGLSVRFINKSGSSMRLVANTAGGQKPYPGFDQSKTVGTGTVYEFVFTIPGTWGIKNQFDDSHFFTLVVKQ